MPTQQPLLLDVWEGSEVEGGRATVAGWRQLWREVTHDGEVYHWSKHYEF